MSGTPSSREQRDEVIGNLSPCCLAANEFYKLSKAGGGWVFFSAPYYLIPQFVSSFFTEVQASLRMAGDGIIWITGGLSWGNRNQTQAFIDEILDW